MMDIGISDFTMIPGQSPSPVERLPPIGFERSLSNPSPTLTPSLFTQTTPKDRCKIRRAKFYDRMEFVCVLKQVVPRGVIRIVASDEWKFPIWNGNLDESATLPPQMLGSSSPSDGFTNAAGTAWHASDTYYAFNHKEIPRCAFRMFVGGMPNSMSAKQLATVLNDIFGHVDCVRIQFNPGNSNPSRCATVDFWHVASAFAAVYYQRLNIYPFIKNSAWCSHCREVTYEPILCREVACMTKYMCLMCWKKSHRQQTMGRADHEPLMRHPTEEVKNIQMWFRFPPSLLEMIKNSVEFPEYLAKMSDANKPVALQDPNVAEIMARIDGHDVLCHACHVSPPPTAMGLHDSPRINSDYYEGIWNASTALLQLINSQS
ncbi:unnamed protein product [Notodromas monacha]|uniref:Cytoplasmic polyadenylation element-binding protein ZZ domain-containing protein n=1 Tax=Notodromas monacha TaxID=399045 RepID=A0A7R9BVC1_9CRUS|nr:unnamed protein product [Notodromas monacha]CAG0920807.1 unnamed protein product [Notodromas monacha]